MVISRDFRSRSHEGRQVPANAHTTTYDTTSGLDLLWGLRCITRHPRPDHPYSVTLIRRWRSGLSVGLSQMLDHTGQRVRLFPSGHPIDVRRNNVDVNR